MRPASRCSRSTTSSARSRNSGRRSLQTPNSVDALNGVAVSYDRLGRPDIARVYYEAALAIDPHSPSLLNNLGYSLYLQGDLKNAIDPLTQAAASQDQAAAGSAHRTLALIEAAMQAARAAPAVVATGPSERIEITSAGEQRLVLGGTRPPVETVAGLGEEANLVEVATPWTTADDRALAAHEYAEVRAEMLAAAQAAAPPVAMQAVARLAIQPMAAMVQLPAAVSRRAPELDIADLFAALRFRPDSIVDTKSAVAASQRRLDTVAVASRVGPGANAGGTPMRASFDSDNHELNLFAARMHARRAVTA